MEKQTDGHAVDRRTMLALTGGTLGAYAALASGLVDFSRAAQAEPTPAGGVRQVLSAEEWQTLAAAQARLLPTDELGPGASEVNAIGYLDAALADPGIRFETKKRIRDGARKLDDRARRNWRRPRFADLDPSAQDAALRMFESHPDGVAWLKDMLGFTLEAFLGDPTRGANPGGVGWRFANHTPGEPRPTRPGWQPEEKR